MFHPLRPDTIFIRHSIPVREYPFQLPHWDSFTKNPSFSFVRSTDWMPWFISRPNDWTPENNVVRVLYTNSRLAVNCHCAWTVSWRLMLMVLPANSRLRHPSMKDSHSHTARAAVSITCPSPVRCCWKTSSIASEWNSSMRKTARQRMRGSR